jgi:hypothetical protein
MDMDTETSSGSTTSSNGPLSIGTPDEQLAKAYWVFAGTLIGLAMLVNIKDQLEYKQRSVVSLPIPCL